MCGSFVMGMMRGMGNRLGIHHAAQDEQAESEPHGNYAYP